MSKLAQKIIAENKKTKATTLDLGNCGLTELPLEALDCVWVEELILSSDWDKYDFEKKEWTKFRSQNTGNPNKLTHFPPVHQSLKLLKLLVISGQQIADLASIAGLNDLQQLYCDTNQITDLAPIAELNNLQQLYCDSNQITALAPIAGLINLQLLSCDSNQVVNLAPIAGLCNLQQLSCFNNNITDFAPIVELHNLQLLYCSQNNVADLPPFTGLINLQQLDCSNNQIADLSPVADLINLQKFYCDSNQITDLAPIAGLINLQLLDCSNNQIADLSPIAGLIKMQELYCSDNMIDDLAPIAGLINLLRLYCSDNLIDDLAPILLLVKNGLNPQISSNPLIHPPIEIAEQGKAAILRYFEDLKTQGEEIVYEAKMLILGDAGAGKTSLARKIEDPDAEMPEETADSTPGIAVRPLLLTERQPDFTMHLWDFGGQEVYHSTHQFFLSKRSLYVLLADGRKEEQLDYWLQMQEIYGQDSRLLLVVNQKGDMQPSLPMGDIRRDYPNVQEAQPTVINLKSDRAGAIALRQRIEQQIRNLPQFEQGLRTPKKWAVIRRQLEGLGEDHIALKDFRALCEKEGITERVRQDDLLDFLHNLGAVLHFKEVEGLKQLVILRPDWATGAVYKLLDHTKKKGDNGHFTRKELETVLDCAEYKDYFLELLRLMEKFELCYPAPEDKNVFIVPSLLNDDRPAGSEWADEPDDMQLWYEYSFMPKGIVTRLIVRQHGLLEKPPTVWKRGAIFSYEDARAEVTESYREKRIGIRASGKQAKTLLTMLARDIDALNNGFHFNERMTLRQIVPCVCAVCSKSGQPHPFTYKELTYRLERRRNSIECGVSLNPISIPNLLRETFSDADLILEVYEQRERLEHFDTRKRMEHIRNIAKKIHPGFEIAPRAFFSYSKTDIDYLKEFKKHLKTLERNNEISFWDDSMIAPGEEWDDSIRDALAKSTVIFLLVSADFLNTDYIWEVEIKEAIRRHEAGTATVIPIKMRPCDWTGTPFSHLQGIPRKDMKIGGNPRNDEAWLEVVNEVRVLLKNRK